MQRAVRFTCVKKPVPPNFEFHPARARKPRPCLAPPSLSLSPFSLSRLAGTRLPLFRAVASSSHTFSLSIDASDLPFESLRFPLCALRRRHLSGTPADIFESQDKLRDVEFESDDRRRKFLTCLQISFEIVILKLIDTLTICRRSHSLSSHSPMFLYDKSTRPCPSTCPRFLIPFRIQVSSRLLPFQLPPLSLLSPFAKTQSSVPREVKLLSISPTMSVWLSVRMQSSSRSKMRNMGNDN